MLPLVRRAGTQVHATAQAAARTPHCGVTGRRAWSLELRRRECGMTRRHIHRRAFLAFGFALPTHSIKDESSPGDRSLSSASMPANGGHTTHTFLTEHPARVHAAPAPWA